MRQPATSACEPMKARHIAARRSRLYRPQCNPLEERYLLSVTLSGKEPTVPLVGSPVVWTATSSGQGASPVYQFSVAPAGGPIQVVQDFSQNNSFTWNPMEEGNYVIYASVKNSYSETTGETATAAYTVDSRATGSRPVISPTQNPLVALFSAPPTAGLSIVVQYKLEGSKGPWQTTAPLPLVPGESTNFLVANMLPKTTYEMRDLLNNGKTSALEPFKTGSLPKSLKFPTFTVQHAPSPGTAANQNVVMHFGIDSPLGTVDTLATNLSGKVVWYYNPVASAFPSYGTSVVPGGTILMLGNNLNTVGGVATLREVDLAGDTVRETNIDAINAELAAMGQNSITDFNHDAQRLPNGDTAILATSPRTIDVNGTPTLYAGDLVIVLNQNFQVAWVWDPFQWLNTNRLPTLGEGPTDWLHANSVAWSPVDGDLLVSLRSQDWVVKIDYADGTGDGHVVWTLGAGGDFTINSTAPSPWFSHQHDVRYVNDNTIVVFDDGNTRQSKNPKADSRGQEYVLNETTMTATLVVNADLGNYASAIGSAQLLPNGNLDFDSGFAEQTIEVTPKGVKTYVLKMNLTGLQYRSYIYSNLYGF